MFLTRSSNFIMYFLVLEEKLAYLYIYIYFFNMEMYTTISTLAIDQHDVRVLVNVNTTLYFRMFVKHLSKNEHLIFHEGKSSNTHFCLLTTILTHWIEMNGIIVIRM